MKSHSQQPDEEVSLRELIENTRNMIGYLLRKWIVILIVGLVGGAIGLLYALSQPEKYESRLSFVVEESKSGVGGLASIAGQFGFDLGGSGGGIFSADNILLFLRSESLCRETLFTNYDSAGNEVLADKYAESNDLKDKWEKDEDIGRISFAKYKNGNLPRLEDSLIQLLTKKILEKDLSVAKPDRKASFIEVKVSMRDELLSKYFNDRLVKIATERFIESKIKLKALNVAKLQKRADSLGALLNNRTYSAAASQQSLLDVNPGLRTMPVAAEISTRDKQMIATIFAEVVKNLEIGKVSLSQETPTIAIVDQSSLPLVKEKVSKTFSVLVGGVMAGLMCIAILLFRRWWKKQSSLSKNKEAGRTEDASPKIVVRSGKTDVEYQD